MRGALLTALLACGPATRMPAAELPLGPVDRADFFVLSCINAYLKRHALPLHDGSLAYVVEHLDAEPEDMERLYATASAVAASIPPPDPTDEEHGAQAVLLRCRQATPR